MKICTAFKECSVVACPHINPHEEVNGNENSCAAACDVKGGVSGSTCIKAELVPA